MSEGWFNSRTIATTAPKYRQTEKADALLGRGINKVTFPERVPGRGVQAHKTDQLCSRLIASKHHNQHNPRNAAIPAFHSRQLQEGSLIMDSLIHTYPMQIPFVT